MGEFADIEYGEEIGRGGYGKVYKVTNYLQPAVIKIINCPEEEDRKIFERECKIMMRIEAHPNIVKMLESKYSNQSSEMGIILEYCAGGELKRLIKDPEIIYSMRTVVEWGIQLFGALSHFFEEYQIVHRDIKPANILIKDTIDHLGQGQIPTLKIGDFGLGKVIEQTCEPTRLAGTYRYMSPPQIYGKPDVTQSKKDVLDSHKNDVYSLGLVLWEIIERTAVFTEYEYESESGPGFDREALLCDIALKRLSRLNSPKCQEEIQRIVDRCVLFDRHSRPLANEVLNLLKEIKETNDFISSLELSPRHDENQTDLIRPIGFDGTKRIVNISEIDEFTEILRKRSERKGLSKAIGEVMREKFSVLSSKEKGEFVKKAQGIVSELQQESRYFDETNTFLEEANKEIVDMHLFQKNKTIEETFELLVLLDFNHHAKDWVFWLYYQDVSVYEAGDFLQAHFWSIYPSKHRYPVNAISALEELKSTYYTTRFQVRCYFSQATGEEWLYLGLQGKEIFVRKDLKLCKDIEGDWLKGREKKVWQCYSEGNSSLDHNQLHYSHDETIDLDRVVEVFKKRLESMKKRAKVYIDSLVSVEQLKDSSQCIDFFTHLIKSPYPGYIFQLRNPPRPICKHEGKCSMDGFEKVENNLKFFDFLFSGLPKDLYIPICSDIAQNEVEFLQDFIPMIESLDSDKFYRTVRPFLFLAIQNFLGFDFFVLLDHPNNYATGEKIPAFTLTRKFHNVDAGLVQKHLNEIDPNKRVYACVLWHKCMNMDGWRKAAKSCYMEDRWGRCKDMGEWMNAMDECMNMDRNGVHSDEEKLMKAIDAHRWRGAMNGWNEVWSMKMQILDYQGNPKTDWFVREDESTWPKEFLET